MEMHLLLQAAVFPQLLGGADGQPVSCQLLFHLSQYTYLLWF